VLLIKKFNEVKSAIMSEEEIRIAEMLHEEGKMITGVILFGIVFLSMIVLLVGIV
jgi:hypothetical protein